MARAAVIPPSPPKRAARGRSKGTGPAATTAAARAKAKTATITTKTTTGPKKGPARTGATSKSDDMDEETDDDELGVIDNKAEPTTVRPKGKASTITTTKTATTVSGRGRKPAKKPATPGPESDDDDELAQVDVPKKRVGRPRTKAESQEDASSKQPEPAPKPRGRPKGSTNAKTTAAKARTQVQTETVPSAETSNPKQVMIDSAALRSNMLRGPAKKKTVTFQDMSGSEEEEEPAPAPPAGRRRATPAARRQTGLGAKPARKPAATTGRGRKSAAKEAPKPLSPKKANGVTKSISSYVSSDGEEDELSSTKDQVKFGSPTKHGPQTTGLSSPVKRINLTPRHGSKSVDENGKPVRRSIDFNDIISMSSPTREPSPSPFHYTLRETPRKVGFPVGEHTRPISQPDFAQSQTSPLKASPRKGHVETPRGGGFNLQSDMKPLAQPNFTPGQNSPLKASPKKGHFGTPKASSMAPWDGTKPLSQPDFTPAQSSPLKTSPKKGNLGASFSQSAMQSSTPSFNPRISLFQSPAKRIASPFKTSMTPRNNPPVTEQHEPTRSKDEILPTTEPLTPEAESPLRPQALDENMGEDENEDSADELAGEPDADTHVHHDTQSQAGDDYDEEMDGMAAVPEAEHEIKVEEDNQPAHFREQVDVLTHKDNEEDIRIESTPDFHGIAETFAMDYVDDHMETRVDDHPEEDSGDHIEDRVQSPISNHSAGEDEYHEDAEEPVEDAPQSHTDDHEELAEEPASERQVEHIYDQLNTEVEAEMSEEERAEISDQKDNAEPEIAQPEPELLPRKHNPATHEPEDISTEKSPAPEPTHEDVEAGENIDMEESEDELNYQPSVHEENEESDDFSDGDGFDGYDETTLVGVDITNQHYIDGAHHLSPRGHETERDPSPENVENVPAPISSPPAVSDHHYRDETEDKMDSDEDAESNTGFTPENQSNVSGISRPETPDLSEPALDQRAQGPRSIFDNAPSFTPLAQQFSQWKTSTPQGSQSRQPRRRGVFSIGGVLRRPSGRISVASGDVSYPDISRHSLSGRRKSALAEVVTQHDTEDEPVPEVEQEPEPEAEPETLEDVALNTEESPRQPMPEIFTDPEPEVAETDEHGENLHALHSIPFQDTSPTPATAPSVHDEPDDEKENENISPLPAPAPVTPMKNKTNPLQTFHTVSKVPLKPEGDVSPLKMPRKRGRSLSDTSPTRSSPRRKSLRALDEDNMPSFSPRKSPRVQKPAASPQRRTSDHGARSVERRQSRVSSAPPKSPSRKKTPRKSIGGPAQLLQGAVVYVDVHTTEGEDASGIFIELLQQMGAKCFKTWSWNPRASVSPEDAADPRDKVGITHVVFKDGGVRTLEKVRQAAGVVKCVGVGWVLDCEREGRWVDETEYAVDSSIIPRGGAKRRKSMEPRALSNVNGTLVSSSSSSSSSLAASRRRSGITPPVSRDEPQTPETTTRRYDASNNETYCQAPKTPGYRFNMDDYIGMSPATPFYLSRAKLVQQTCPPKQTREGLFPAPSRNGSDEQEEGGSQKLRLKLEAARRKSLAYKPRRGSPLVD